MLRSTEARSNNFLRYGPYYKSYGSYPFGDLPTAFSDAQLAFAI